MDAGWLRHRDYVTWSLACILSHHAAAPCSINCADHPICDVRRQASWTNVCLDTVHAGDHWTFQLNLCRLVDLPPFHQTLRLLRFELIWTREASAFSVLNADGFHCSPRTTPQWFWELFQRLATGLSEHNPVWRFWRRLPTYRCFAGYWSA